MGPVKVDQVKINEPVIPHEELQWLYNQITHISTLGRIAFLFKNNEYTVTLHGYSASASTMCGAIFKLKEAIGLK